MPAVPFLTLGNKWKKFSRFWGKAVLSIDKIRQFSYYRTTIAQYNGTSL